VIKLINQGKGFIIAKFTLSLTPDQLKQVMKISLATKQPMWQIVAGIFSQGLKDDVRWRKPKRQKVNKYGHFSKAGRGGAAHRRTAS
jgi:hypothetical protein